MIIRQGQHAELIAENSKTEHIIYSEGIRVSASFSSIYKSGHTSFSSMCILCKKIKPQASKEYNRELTMKLQLQKPT